MIRSNRFLKISFFINFIFTALSLHAADSTFIGTLVAEVQQIKPVCSRLEGLTMKCTGGGSGGSCPCPPRENACTQTKVSCDVTGGEIICPNCCFADKCTDEVKASISVCSSQTLCGEKCQGTKPKVCNTTCYKEGPPSSFKTPIYDVVSGYSDNDVYYQCNMKKVDDDGCTCSCPTSSSSADGCKPTTNGKCIECSCGAVKKGGGKSCGSFGRSCSGNNTINCIAVEKIESVVDGCDCKCPAGYSKNYPCGGSGEPACCGTDRSCTPGECVSGNCNPVDPC